MGILETILTIWLTMLSIVALICLIWLLITVVKYIINNIFGN